ncbi:Scr1 family TA system antitoxin-like transcriptional regulator [Streptomyces zhihengii]
MLHAVPSPPAEVPQAPARIMTGLYLRCLREARGIGLEDAARTVQVSASAIGRWERAHSPIRADALTVLLRRYGAADDELDFLVRSLPPQDFGRGGRHVRGGCRLAAYDQWADMAGDEAAARHISLMRSASEVVQYCTVVPAGLRTRDYQQVLLEPEVRVTRDEPVPGLPAWVQQVSRFPDQRWTVLLDETVLARGRGTHPATVAGQLRHLAELMDRERPTGASLTVRILPLSAVRFIHAVGPVAEVAIDGHRMVVRIGLFPCYETGFGPAQVVSAALQEAAGAAWSREATYEALVTAAEAMERRTS